LKDVLTEAQTQQPQSNNRTTISHYRLHVFKMSYQFYSTT